MSLVVKIPSSQGAAIRLAKVHSEVVTASKTEENIFFHVLKSDA
jgi:hypothetical protein